jgi:hypothetical protein
MVPPFAALFLNFLPEIVPEVPRFLLRELRGEYQYDPEVVHLLVHDISGSEE